MKQRVFQWFSLFLVISLLTACGPVVPIHANQESQLAPTLAESIQETHESEPVTVTGSLTYTNTFFTAGVAQPLILLEDQGGFVQRDRKFLFPLESQTLGEITSDFYTSPFTYSISLPAKPNGTLHDVDHDGAEETGVMIFAVAYWTNTWGDPYLERRDQGGGGWSTWYVSTKISDDRDLYREVFGGKYLVYAPDSAQQFPSDFGADKKLFTDDDPIMDLLQGWSVIDMDQSPFKVDRSPNPVIDLYEPESAALEDFSQFGYAEAFDKMLEKFKNEYAFTEFKNIDWDAKAKEFRPRFVEAEQGKDKHAYFIALRDFIWSVPDSHVGFDTSVLQEDFSADIAGGLGFAIRETDDGKVIANFIVNNGPASKAGMVWGAEIISFDGKPIADFVSAVLPWSSPFSNEDIKHLQQLRYATRFRLDKGQVEVKFKNPDRAEQVANLDVVNEMDSFNFSSFRAGQPPTSLPVEFEILPSGYGYLKISSFFDNELLSIQVWERAIKYFNENQVPGVVIDMRVNSGGNGWLANQMAAYFFDEETIVGNTARYDDSTGEFYMDISDEAPMIPPREELRYKGPVVVMVGPACVSACEFFSYAMTVNDRALVVGQYSSNGAGGSVEDLMMPENVSVRMTIGRAVDAQGKIHLEGSGVVPDVRAPVTVEALKRISDGEDVILEAAVKVLNTPSGAGITPSASPKLSLPADAESSFKSGASFLEDLAREKYDPSAFAQPGVVAYSIPLGEEKPVLWAYAWCASDAESLNENFKNIELKFMLNGEEIPADSFATYDLLNNDRLCRLVHTALSGWTPGEHHLSTTAKFKAKLNDGLADYEPGDYVLDYTVYVKP